MREFLHNFSIRIRFGTYGGGGNRPSVVCVTSRIYRHTYMCVVYACRSGENFASEQAERGGRDCAARAKRKHAAVPRELTGRTETARIRVNARATALSFSFTAHWHTMAHALTCPTDVRDARTLLGAVSVARRRKKKKKKEGRKFADGDILWHCYFRMAPAWTRTVLLFSSFHLAFPRCRGDACVLQSVQVSTSCSSHDRVLSFLTCVAVSLVFLFCTLSGTRAYIYV